ncbi:MAG: formylglycine-generating enzyme family protein [Synechococcus sp.]
MQLSDRVEDILQKADETNSANVGVAIDEEKESVSLVSADVANSMSAKPIEVSELKLAAMRAEIEGDIGKATELWHQILAQVPSDSEAAGQLTRLKQFSGTEKVAGSRSTVPQDFSDDLDDGVLLKMLALSGGDFLMGSPSEEEGRFEDEGPQHKVSLTAFWMGMYPVTQEQWKQVAGYSKVNVDLSACPSTFPGDDRPVERISWQEAVEFCDRLSQKTGKLYRLPSEAEWEYACRAGTATPFYFGETISTDLANYDGNYVYGQGKKGEYRKQTTPVGSFQANAFGLYDMHGNVWEWCSDWWHKNYDGATPGGIPWIKGGEKNERVLRGGSWRSNPWDCRLASRDRFVPDVRGGNGGFRVVCSSA